MSLTLGGSSTYRSLSHMSATKAKMDKSPERIASWPLVYYQRLMTRVVWPSP